MKPLRDRIVIEINQESKEKQTESGLFLQAPRWADPDNVAKVISRGPEVSTVAINEYVLIDPYAYIDTKEENIKIIREKDILCVLDEPTSQAE